METMRVSARVCIWDCLSKQTERTNVLRWCRRNCGTETGFAHCGPEIERRWKWAPSAIRRGAKHLGEEQTREILRGWTAFVGDSIDRKVMVALLGAHGSGAGEDSFERHADFTWRETEQTPRTAIDSGYGNVISFHWSPFPENATNLLASWAEQDTAPDTIIVSVSLWHMLHIHDSEVFKGQLHELKKAAEKLTTTSKGERTNEKRKSKDALRYPRLVALTTPEIHHGYLKTAEKRQYMTPYNVDAYNKAMKYANLFSVEGPFDILDVFALTYGALCNVWYHNLVNVVTHCWSEPQLSFVL